MSVTSNGKVVTKCDKPKGGIIIISYKLYSMIAATTIILYIELIGERVGCKNNFPYKLLPYMYVYVFKLNTNFL